MCIAQTYLLPSLALLLLLAVGIHAGGSGECNEQGGQCMRTYKFLRVEGDAYCRQVDQISLSEKQLERECGDPESVCCTIDKDVQVSRRKCTKTPKKCTKQGGVCQNDCDTIDRDLCRSGASCTCCIQKKKGCKPKKSNEDLNGFCVAKRKYCENAGGTHIRNGCDCNKAGKTHFCYKKEKEFHWSYEGKTGPEYWADHFPLCGLERQSPIDIISSDATALSDAKPFEFTLYDRTPNSMTLVNNGHSVTCYWNDAAKPFVDEGGLSSQYILAQFHFHWGSDSSKGSEHLIDGKAYPIELHMVHYKSDYGSLGEAVKYDDGLAVLGIMYEVGEENAALKPIIDGLSSVVEADKEHDIQYNMPLDVFLPENTDSFYRYLGSLTTPSCNEVVVWTVFTEPLTLSEAQLEEFRTLLDDYDHAIVDNFRPPQELNGRSIHLFEK